MSIAASDHTWSSSPGAASGQLSGVKQDSRIVSLGSRRGEYTLADLLSEPHLGLELLSGQDEALRAPILGAHSIELEHPAKWLDGGWMMLTMGVRLRNKPQVQRDLIVELQELGASALGFGVGLSFKCVPQALLDEARVRNFPVVLVPEDTQFRDITQAVFHSTVGMESSTFQRLTSLQQNLIRAFTESNPLEAVVQRLGRLVHAPVAVLSLDGDVAAATGSLPVRSIAEQLSGWSPRGIAQFSYEDWRIMAAPIDVSRRTSARWLVIGSTRVTVTDDLARTALQVTAPLIDALLRLSATSRGQDRAIRQSVLDSVLDADGEAADDKTLTARVAALGVDMSGGFHAIVVRDRPSAVPCRAGEDVLEAVEEWLASRLEGLDRGYLLSRRGQELVAVIGDSSVLELIADELLEKWPSTTLGVGREIDRDSDIRISHRDALVAVKHLDARPGDRMLSFDDLDLVTQLLAEVPQERFARKVATISAILEENPIQLEALRAYFAMNRDIKAAADSIFLHPNTLRYRLERLELALGRSLREPSVTASLYCVLTLMSEPATRG